MWICCIYRRQRSLCAVAETRFVPLQSPSAADMQVKGQSSAADRMDVNQAKQEHLLALKGIAGFNLFLL